MWSTIAPFACGQRLAPPEEKNAFSIAASPPHHQRSAHGGAQCAALAPALAGLCGGSRSVCGRGTLGTDAQQNQTIANTSGSLLLAERSALDQLKLQLRQLEGENRSLREDLGFFEKLIPSSSSDGDLAIRGLQAEQQADATLRWQVLVMRPVKNAAEFSGQLELVASGMREGKPWSQRFPGDAQAFKLRQYQRLEGIARLPPHVLVKTLTARILHEGRVRATQTTDVGSQNH